MLSRLVFNSGFPLVCVYCCLSTILTSTYAQLILYSEGLSVDNAVSTACSTAINASISCDPYLVALTEADSFGAINDTALQSSMCAASCGSALSSYHDSVSIACASDPQPWHGIPAVWAGDAVWATYNRTCLKDPKTGEYCSDVIETLAETITTDMSLASLSSTDLCTPCMLALLVQAQATAYSNYGQNYVATYETIQSTCNVTYPTTVQTSPTNVTSDPYFADTNSEQICLSGNTYTVVSGDSCQGIAAAHNVATGTLQAVNNIYPDCTNLIAGSSICLPQICQTYLVQPGDTCWSIAGAYDLTFALFNGYNPTINSDCSNLRAGFNVCVSPAAGVYVPTTIAGATVTQTGVYATATVAPPSPTPFGTTSQCGRYYQAQSGDYCQQISLNNTISVPLFQLINPSVNADCTNLIPGFYYCVFPTVNWNATASANTSVTVAPPGPTPSGTTSSCFVWHTVVSRDYCALIEQEYQISFAQFQLWNPSIDAACNQLLLGDAYCVSGSSSSASSSQPTSTSSPTASTGLTTIAAPAPTASGTTDKCYTWHTVVSGDSCFVLETNYAITFAQFQAWNPSIDSACDNLLLGDAYCVNGS